MGPAPCSGEGSMARNPDSLIRGTAGIPGRGTVRQRFDGEVSMPTLARRCKEIQLGWVWQHTLIPDRLANLRVGGQAGLQSETFVSKTKENQGTEL